MHPYLGGLESLFTEHSFKFQNRLKTKPMKNAIMHNSSLQFTHTSCVVDYRSCGFAEICSSVNGVNVCSFDIWVPIAVIFIVLSVILTVVTVLVFKEYRKQQIKGRKENIEYCDKE